METRKEVLDRLAAKAKRLRPDDPVNYPKHYTNHQSGIEVINYSRLLPFGPGNAVKYVMRRDEKSNPGQDLDKAIWYIKDSIKSSVSYRTTLQMKLIVSEVSAYEGNVHVRDFLKALYYPAKKGWLRRFLIGSEPNMRAALAALQRLRRQYP